MTTLSLDLAKELQIACKAKGITMPESYFMHTTMGVYPKASAERRQSETPVFLSNHMNTFGILAPAYTLCELLEWLPKHIEQDGRVYEKTLLFSYIQNQYEASYLHGMHLMIYFYDPNPCDACGKLLIWIIKEGLIK